MFVSSTNPFSHSCHPQSLGLRSAANPSNLEFEDTLWYFAAVEVGGKDWGFTWDVFEVTFSQNRLCQREFYCRLGNVHAECVPSQHQTHC